MIPFLEQTLVLIKPDAVLRGLMGDILDRFECAGLTVIAIKMVRPSLEKARNHYPTTDAQLIQMGEKTLSTYQQFQLDPVELLGTSNAREIGLILHEWNAEFLSSGPVVACVLQGVHAVKKTRAICGSTMPRDAQPGTIRGDYSSVSPALSNLQKTAVYNLVHASDNENDPNEPAAEIAYWFSPDEIIDHSLVDAYAMYKGGNDESS